MVIRSGCTTFAARNGSHMKKLVLLALACPCIVSCEKVVLEEYPELETFYAESLGLSAVSTDSVKLFAVKVEDYGSEYPDCKGNALYGKIQANIKTASLRITVEADTAWAGTTYIEF